MNWKKVLYVSARSLLLLPIHLAMLGVGLGGLFLLPLWVFALYGPQSLVNATPGAQWLREATFAVATFEGNPLLLAYEGWARWEVLLAEGSHAWFGVLLVCVWMAGAGLLLAPFLALFHTHPKEARANDVC